MNRRRRAVGTLGAVGALLLAGCAEPLPVPQPEPVPAVAPAAVSTDQVDRVLEELAAVLAQADEARDPDALRTRVTGPAARVRAAEYVLAEAGAEDAVTDVPATAQTVVAPTTDTWPRTMMVVTEPPEDLQAPLLLTLVQDDPRDPYRLWAWARLFPGVQMPATAQPELGSEPVAPDGDDLVLPAGEVVAAYADVQYRGRRSQYAPLLDVDDPLSQGLTTTRNAYAALVADNGTIRETYEAPEGAYALRTADGGAIVVGSFRTRTAITLEDSTLTIGDQTAALLGGTTTITENLEIIWTSMVALRVPPAGSEEPVEVLGAEHSPTSATGR